MNLKNLKILKIFIQIKTKYFAVFKFSHLLKKHKNKLVILTIISLITTALSTITPLITKTLIDDFYELKDWRIFYWAAAAYLVVILGGWLFGVVSSYLSTYLNERFTFDLSIDLQKTISKLKYKFTQNRNTGEHIFRHTTDVASIGNVLISFFPTIVLIISQITFFFIIAFKLAPKLTIIYMGVLPVLILLVILKNKKIRPLQVNLREYSSDINDFHGQFFQGILTTKIFAREKFEQISLLNVLKIKFKQVFKLWRTDTVYSSLTLFAGSFWNMFILFYGWSLVANGDLKLGSLIALQMYLNRLIIPFKTGSLLISKLVRSSVAADRLIETYNAEKEPEIINNSEKQLFEGTIELSDVSFKYTEGKEVLQNINMVIDPSKIIGITGPSGVGKTTVVNLISKLYDIDSGNITIDGKNVNSINTTLLRNNISIVSQEPYLFTGTIRENILYGNLNASSEDIELACKSANIYSFISGLENGINTIIGKNGISVSVGEKKRLGLARALVKKASILILDEFTASLDEISEKDILGNIRKNYPKQSILIISHKVSNLLNCDTVFVLNNGTIAEHGNPTKLIEGNGLLRRLYQLQYKFFNLNLEKEYDEIEKEVSNKQ